MPMGIVSDEDFRKEKENLTPVPSHPLPTGNNGNNSNEVQAEIKDVTRGRPSGSVEVPDGLRKLIGDASITDGRQSALELAQNFGISPSSVSAYANGSRSTASYDDQPNKGVVDEARVRVQKKARQKMLLAMNKLTPDKMETAKAKDLAGIAKDMAAVVRAMEPETKSSDAPTNGPTFIFYSPQQRKEEVFDVVYAKEQDWNHRWMQNSLNGS